MHVFQGVSCGHVISRSSGTGVQCSLESEYFPVHEFFVAIVLSVNG